MRYDIAAVLYCEILITRSVAMATIISVATIGESYFLGDLVSTYQLGTCYEIVINRHTS